MTRMTRAILPLALAAASAGCAPPPYSVPEDTGGGDTSDSGHTGETAVPPPPEPTVRIIFPESSSTVYYCTTFMVAVDVDNLVMTEEHFGGDPVEGEGHWHLYVDGSYVGATWKEYYFVPEAKALTEGEHQLDVRLAGNDHQAFDPEISYQVEILVDDTPPDDPGTEEVETCMGATGATSGSMDTGMGDTGMGDMGY